MCVRVCVCVEGVGGLVWVTGGEKKHTEGREKKNNSSLRCHYLHKSDVCMFKKKSARHREH